MKTIVVLSVTLAGVILLSGTAGAIEAPAADLVLMHGRIITVDAKDHVEAALAARRGRILQVGGDRSIQRLVGPGLPKPANGSSAAAGTSPGSPSGVTPPPPIPTA